MMNNTASLTRLDSIAEPTESDLLALVSETEDMDVTDWEALIEPVITVKVVDEDFWNEDENVHDDRYDGEGVPSWSAWA
jgi:hypothetical protein